MGEGLYLWVKALHVAAVLTFVSGVLAVNIGFVALGANGQDVLAIRMLRRWDRRVTLPALLGVWGFGIALLVMGGWFTQSWLQLKLVLVLLLSGLHGVQSGQLRRAAENGKSAASRLALPTLACAVAIALLAVMKPL